MKVLVIDAERCFVGYVDSPVARKVLREKRARVWRKTPLTIMLAPGDHALPSFVERKPKMNPNPMHPSGNVSLHDALASPSEVELNAYLREDRDVWVQNMTATHLSMELEAEGTTHRAYITMGAAPFRLTNRIAIDALRKARNVLQRFIDARALRIMPDAEVRAFFERRAGELGLPSAQAAMHHEQTQRNAQERRPESHEQVQVTDDGQVRFAPPKTLQELMGVAQPPVGYGPQPQPQMAQPYYPNGQPAPAPGGWNLTPNSLAAVAAAGQQQAAMMQQQAGAPNGLGGFFQGVLQQQAQAAQDPNGGFAPQPRVHPKVQHFCHQVSSTLGPEARQTGAWLIENLRTLEMTLTIADLQHVLSNPGYRSVAIYAQGVIDSRRAQPAPSAVETITEDVL